MGLQYYFRQRLFNAGLLVICLGWVACEKPSITAPDQENSIEQVSVSMKLAIPQSLQGIISRVEYIISADDMETMNGELEIEADSTVRGTIPGIKAGSNRLFTLNAYDNNNTLTHAGSTTSDIITGGIATVRIQIEPLSGTAEIEGEITNPQVYTESQYPFIITLEKLEILPEDQLKLTLNFANVTQDTLLSIQASIGTNALDDEGNSYSYFGGWSRTEWVIVQSKRSTKVFVLCKSNIPVEKEGDEFTVSIHFRYWCEGCNTDITAVGFIEVTPN